MHEEPTTVIVQRYLDALPGDTAAELTVRELLERAAGRLRLLCTTLLYKSYEVEGELGRGGMGVVYRARHLRLNRFVALKMLLAGAFARPEERDRFLRERRPWRRWGTRMSCRSTSLASWTGCRTSPWNTSRGAA